MTDRTLTHQLVLLGIAELREQGETPAHAGEIRRVCRDKLDGVDGDLVGTPTEAEIARALNELEVDGLVEGIRGDRSVAGKGRPDYDLAVDPTAIHDEITDDDRLEPIANRG
ncbi:MAG: hypothetical protein ABEJ40_05730 [Haloarculaceae archaeon]